MLPSAAGFRRGREEKSVESDGEGGRVLVRGKEVDRQRQHRRCLLGPPESQGRREGRTEGDERTEGDR